MIALIGKENFCPRVSIKVTSVYRQLQEKHAPSRARKAKVHNSTMHCIRTNIIIATTVTKKDVNLMAVLPQYNDSNDIQTHPYIIIVRKLRVQEGLSAIGDLATMWVF